MEHRSKEVTAPATAPPPLEGLRVLEYASLVSGPFCGKLLADLGAEVVKVEPPPEGDPSRRLGPFPQDLPHPETSCLFLYLNTNKMGMTLDVATPPGQELFKRLVANCDLLLEDTPPGTLDRLGLGYADLERINPGLVVVSVTPYGQTGPHAHWKAYDLNSCHVGGEGWLTPSGLSARLFPQREPLKAGGRVGDYYCGLTATVAALGALHSRLTTGQGQHVDVSKQEAHASLARRALTLWANLNILETRRARDLNYGGVVPCRDGYVEMVVLEEHQWQALVEMMGDPDWAHQPPIADPTTRGKHGGEINDHLFQWAQTRSRHDIYQAALERGVPLGVFYSPTDALASRHQRERGFFVPTEHPVAGQYETPHPPFRLSASPWRLHRPAPRLGHHNEALYCGVLGYSRQELVQLRQAGVI